MFQLTTRWIWILALALSAAEVFAAESRGLDRIVSVRIEAQPLSTALIELSKQARVQVVTPAAKVKHLDTQGVNGEMSLAMALTKLLEGTRLGFHEAGANTIGLNEVVESTDLLSAQTNFQMAQASDAFFSADAPASEQGSDEQ